MLNWHHIVLVYNGQNLIVYMDNQAYSATQTVGGMCNDIYYITIISSAKTEDLISRADGFSDLSIIIIRPSSCVCLSAFTLNRYSSLSSYSLILNFVLGKLGI